MKNNKKGRKSGCEGISSASRKADIAPTFKIKFNISREDISCFIGDRKQSKRAVFKRS